MDLGVDEVDYGDTIGAGTAENMAAMPGSESGSSIRRPHRRRIFTTPVSLSVRRTGPGVRSF